MDVHPPPHPPARAPGHRLPHRRHAPSRIPSAAPLSSLVLRPLAVATAAAEAEARSARERETGPRSQPAEKPQPATAPPPPSRMSHQHAPARHTPPFAPRRGWKSADTHTHIWATRAVTSHAGGSADLSLFCKQPCLLGFPTGLNPVSPFRPSPAFSFSSSQLHTAS
jgi:hypothetical protein